MNLAMPRTPPVALNVQQVGHLKREAPSVRNVRLGSTGTLPGPIAQIAMLASTGNQVMLPVNAEIACLVSFKIQLDKHHASNAFLGCTNRRQSSASVLNVHKIPTRTTQGASLARAVQRARTRLAQEAPRASHAAPEASEKDAKRAPSDGLVLLRN